MPVEIDEAQLAALQATAQTVQRMYQHPKARALLQQAEKAFNPNTVIPEIDAAEPVLAEVRKLNKRLDDSEAERATRAAKRAEEDSRRNAQSMFERGRADLRSQGWEQEGIDKIEELMIKRGIADHDAAAALYEKQNPPPPPMEPVTNKFNVFAPKDDKEQKLQELLINKKDDAFLNAIIPEILQDARSPKRMGR